MTGEESSERGSAQGGPFAVAVECGPYQAEGEVAGLGERDVTRGVFLAFAALVDDPDTDPDELGEFLSASVEETGQLWVYPTDVFLQNLLHRRGDQSKVRRALERLAPQEAEEERGSD